MSVSYPVHVEAHIDPRLSRWQWLFKWLLAIPHFVVLAFLWMAFFVLSVVAFFAILFTGRYPRGIFDFNVGVLRWTWRVQYYAYGALGTDRYPPFSLQESNDYPAHLEIEYPDHLSRGLVLVKWWLLAIPHYLIVGLFLGGVSWAASDAGRDGDHWAAGGAGLISLLVLFAAVVLLFSGRYPRSIFDLVLGLNRWVLRVAAYAALMTDVYPPFRLDQGGDDPTALRTALPSPAPFAAAHTAPAPAAVPAPPTARSAAWPVDPALPERPADPVAETPIGGHVQPHVAPAPTADRPWTAGRVVALVAGCLLLLGSFAVGLAGGALAVADQALRDDGGFLMSGTTELTTDTYAIATTSITLDSDVPSTLPHRVLGDVKVTATGTATPVFLGIARTADVDAYLAGVEHATLTDLSGGPSYDTSGGQAPQVLPADLDIWSARTVGTGTQEIVWPARAGDWTLVVMNADGSPGVSSDVAAGATVPALDWLVPTLLIAAAVGLALAILLLVVALHGPRERAGAAA